MADSAPIQVGPGPESLPPAGHARREVLKARKQRLDEIAEGLAANTDMPVYAVDPKKLKEEPEILKHYDFVNQQFSVSHKVAGKVYFWCRDERTAIAQKQTEVRMWLGANAQPWEIIGNGPEFPECPDLKGADGYRRIGDVILMRLDLDTYTALHKRMAVVQRYRETSLNESLTEFEKRLGAKVSVLAGSDDPRNLYRKNVPQGGPLVHAGRLED